MPLLYHYILFHCRPQVAPGSNSICVHSNTLASFDWVFLAQWSQYNSPKRTNPSGTPDRLNQMFKSFKTFFIISHTILACCQLTYCWSDYGNTLKNNQSQIITIRSWGQSGVKHPLNRSLLHLTFVSSGCGVWAAWLWGILSGDRWGSVLFWRWRRWRGIKPGVKQTEVSGLCEDPQRTVSSYSS